jgi:hypothetical protein
MAKMIAAVVVVVVGLVYSPPYTYWGIERTSGDDD